jgi:hypothetical protein
MTKNMEWETSLLMTYQQMVVKKLQFQLMVVKNQPQLMVVKSQPQMIMVKMRVQ